MGEEQLLRDRITVQDTIIAIAHHFLKDYAWHYPKCNASDHDMDQYHCNCGYRQNFDKIESAILKYRQKYG